MTPPELLASLRSRGLTLTVEWGQLLVSPRAMLTPADVEAIKAGRDALIVLIDPSLAPPAPAAPPDTLGEVIAAVAERAWLDPPDFPGGPVQMRESVIVRLDGFPAVAVSPAEAEALDRLAAWNEAARARWQKSGAARAARRR